MYMSVSIYKLDHDLDTLRQHESSMFPHNQVSTLFITRVKTGVEETVVQRLTCALCIKKIGRKTVQMCATSRVPLCIL